jgi:hypothetical protein
MRPKSEEYPLIFRWESEREAAESPRPWTEQCLTCQALYDFAHRKRTLDIAQLQHVLTCKFCLTGYATFAGLSMKEARAKIEESVVTQPCGTISRAVVIQEARAKIEEIVVTSMKVFVLNVVLRSVKKWAVWRDKDAGATDEVQPVEARTWEVEKDGSKHIVLPPDVAERCYGTREQTVTLTLKRLPDLLSPGTFVAELEVSPAPVRDAITFVVPFLDGEQRELVVRVPRSQRPNAFAQMGGLPAEAFGAEDWDVQLGIKP